MGQPKYAPQAKYDSTHTQRVYIKLNLQTDADILDHLDKQPSKQGYIKALIRADMARASNTDKD